VLRDRFTGHLTCLLSLRNGGDELPHTLTLPPSRASQLCRPPPFQVKLTVNGMVVPIQMKLGSSGEAFFVRQVAETDEVGWPAAVASVLWAGQQHPRYLVSCVCERV
jgi:hypothetical protein